ncbi:MAG: helix-turn-helix transcriptional regulator [Lachnospiraceae bacterium]|nr:helix-turn-helix transcriptional regulator [Lachnospiraceae bacterium]
MFSFEPLWETMKRKGISQYDLLTGGIDKRTLDQLRHNRNITILTLAKICNIIQCTPNEVVRINLDSPTEAEKQ